MKKYLSILLVVVLALSLVACNSAAPAPSASAAASSEAPAANTAAESGAPAAEETAASTLDGDKPELKILTMYQAYNMEEQPSYKLVEEITGYKVKFFNLPQDNPEQKLLLEVSSGAEYDLLMRISQNGYSQLASQNALIDLTPLLDQHGDHIKAAVSDIAWRSVENNGVIFGIPNEDGVPTEDKPYGLLKGGIGVRSDVLTEMGATVPTTLDELTTFLTDAKAKYNLSPLTVNKAGQFAPSIMSAFGITEQMFFDIDGVYTHRIKHPNLPAYLGYLQQLYKDKLLDNDMPINTADNAKEKFASKNAVAVSPLMFWDIPSMITALHTNNPDCEIQFITPLKADADTQAVATIMVGSKWFNAIPQTGANPDHVMNWLNIISERENFQRIYVGEEGVSYEIKDGSYYPIFPSFDEYTNADKFTGPWDAPYAFQLWQARARKTPEMAKSYEEMNATIDQVKVNTSIENYGITQAVVQEKKPALEQAFADAFLTAIVDGTDPATALAAMQKEWDANGGLEVETAMQTWYDANK